MSTREGVSLHDLGPLAWVMGELRYALEDAVDVVRAFVSDNADSRATDLAEVDATALRLARQHLHQAAGALDMVELSAAALTVRALEAALARLIQRPDLAIPATADTVARGARALLDQLDRALRQRALPDLALFPTYRDWQQLAGAPRAHPADLWAPEGSEHMPVQAWSLPEGKVYAPGPAVRAHLDRLVLQVVKQLSPQAAAPLAQLASGLCRGSADPLVRQWWLTAAAYFEAVAHSLLPDSVPVKRAASSVLLQYSAWTQGDTQGLSAAMHDLHALLAQAVPVDVQATPCLALLWQMHGWRPEQAWNWEQQALGLIDPAVLTQARAAVAQAQRAWAVSADTASGATSAAALRSPLLQLAQALRTLHPACAGLAQAWQRLAEQEALPSDLERWPGLALEASHNLLCLDAELAAFDPLQTTLAERMATLVERLQCVLQGQAVPPPQPWMTEVYQHLSEQRSLADVVAQVQAELAGVESVLDAWFRRVAVSGATTEEGVTSPVAGAGMGVMTLSSLPGQLAALQGVVHMLGLDVAMPALASAQRQVEQWLLSESVVPGGPWQAQAEQVGANLAALGAMLESLVRQPGWAREAYVFDHATGRLQLRTLVEQVAPGVLEAAGPAVSVTPEPSTSPAAEPDAELLAIFVDEAREVLDQTSPLVTALREQPHQSAGLTALRRGFHTLKGSARMVGLTGLGEAAWAMEQLFNAVLAEQQPATPALLDLTHSVQVRMRQWVEELAAGRAESAWLDPAPVRASADALRLHGEALPLTGPEPEIQTGAQLEIPASLNAEPSGAAASPEEPLPESPAESALEHEWPDAPFEPEFKHIGPLSIDLELYNVFLNEADEWSRRLGHALSEWALTPQEPLAVEWPALAHSLAGGSGTVGYTGLSQLARALEHALERALALQAQGLQLSGSDVERLVHAAEEVRTLLHQFAAGFLKEPQPSTLAALADCAHSGQLDAEDAGTDIAPSHVFDVSVQAEPASESTIDTLDTDLFAVFEDEALDLLPRLGAALRQWTARPDNTGARAEALRNLHTFKGSARLAGALRLGELAHRLESDVLALPDIPVNAELLRPLLGGLDALVARFDTLRRLFAQGESAAHAAQLEGVRVRAPEGAVTPALPPVQSPWSTPGASLSSIAPGPLPSPAAGSGLSVRVRAELLDQLMLQTGDVMLSRSRLEGDMRALRQSFKDMSGNIERLRHQLRDLELQTETQMQSRLAQSRDIEGRFDPLEFDRYTRVQELTRLLAESVNDVATVQHHLQRSVEAAEGNLAAQSRQTRDLQRDLLRTRMVAFDALTERLHRTLRQAAESQGKQAELQLDGAELEVDRGVLDRLAPVLEHLLRNAVVHGLETPTERAAAGKPAVGRVCLQLQHSGKDLALQFSDDGVGLDLPRLRERALALGLHDPDVPFDAAAAVHCMFQPGFSTASELTELAGRGIGLDVVRTEVLGLGGRIEHFAPDGGGTGFRLVVPLSTAVTQVVMLRVGDFSFGVPAQWVEQVRRAPAPDLIAAYVSGQWPGDDAPMPFFWAGALFALSTESTDPQAHLARNWPVLEFYSAGQHVAWHVDEVLGQQEVVVKPLGPQLERLPGLVGATVLASGAVSLIYNPVALTALYGESARAWVRALRTQAGQLPSDKASLVGQPGAGAASGDAPLVLVVDDSITVRRVTQRLLKREGYRVALAADGLQALERLREELPVVLLCDIEMPRMDGFELVQQLRAEPAWADLPVVMITSRLADKHRSHAQSLGVDHYLGKPYDEQELLALVAGYARLAPHAPPPGWSG